MKCNRTLALLVLVFALVGLAAGQGNVFLQATLDASNVAGAGKASIAMFPNGVGSANIMLEFKFTGGPATTSVPVLGCMRGGTCATLTTLAVGTNVNFAINAVYDYISMTPVFTGGSNPFVTINYSAISQSSGGQAFAVDASNRLITIGAGGSNGIAQSNPIYIMPNATSGATCCAGTPIVLAAVTTALNIKASGGALYWVQGTNTTAAACYLQLFDVVQGSVTLGTTTPKAVVSLGVVAGASGTASVAPFGLYFSSTGLSVAATTTPTGAATCATGAVVSAIAS